MILWRNEGLYLPQMLHHQSDNFKNNDNGCFIALLFLLEKYKMSVSSIRGMLTIGFPASQPEEVLNDT